MIILKIGGAVITDKSRGVKSSAKIEEIKRVAEGIAKNLEGKMILVHGVGSFGHPYVEEFKLKERKDLKGIIKAHLECKKLNLLVCEALMEQGLNPYPIHPFTFFKIENGKIIFDHKFIEQIIEEGFIPVLHGDMVYNVTDRKFEVISGDEIVIELAQIFDVKKVGFATDVEGVIINGKVADMIERKDIHKILKVVENAKNKSDVTGGMKGKLIAISKLKVNTYIFHAKYIDKFLRDEHVGTLIR
ncbi:MAG TPA: isopentenyl phosphate kinase family protein [Archaeoglobus profundus]|nr:isopentenyl phosphate kinase family protein [Archaeoglobus profundus]